MQQRYFDPYAERGYAAPTDEESAQYRAISEAPEFAYLRSLRETSLAAQTPDLADGRVVAAAIDYPLAREIRQFLYPLTFESARARVRERFSLDVIHARFGLVECTSPPEGHEQDEGEWRWWRLGIQQNEEDDSPLRLGIKCDMVQGHLSYRWVGDWADVVEEGNDTGDAEDDTGVGA